MNLKMNKLNGEAYNLFILKIEIDQNRLFLIYIRTIKLFKW